MISDNFDRANETPLAAPWVLGTGETAMNLSSNVAVPSDTNNDACMIYTGATLYPDHGSAGKLACSGTNGGGAGATLWVRHSLSARTGYRVATSKAGGNNTFVHRFVTGTATQILAFAQSWNDGDEWAIEATGAASGTLIRLFRNGVQVNTITDTAGTVPAAGAPGIGYSGINTGCSVNDWRAYDLGAPWRPNKGPVSW